MNSIKITQVNVCFLGENTDKDVISIFESFIAKLPIHIKVIRVILCRYSNINKTILEKYLNFENEFGLRIVFLGFELSSNDNSEFDEDKVKRVIEANDVNERFQMVFELSDYIFCFGSSNEFNNEFNNVVDNLNTYKNENKSLTKPTLLDKFCFFDENSFNHNINGNIRSIDDFLKTKLEIPYEIDISTKEKEIENSTELTINEKIKELIEKINKKINNKNEQNCILAFDIAYVYEKTYLDSKPHYEGKYSSMCIKEYDDILFSFFEENNSLIYNYLNKGSKFKVETEYRYLDNSGTTVKVASPKLEIEVNENSLLTKDENKRDATFDNWCDFLEDKRIGRFATWKGYNIQLSENENLNISLFILYDFTLPSVLRRKIALLIDEFSFNYSIFYFQEKLKELYSNVEKNAIQNAVTKVFGRNFAHNIGSHVAIRATNKKVKDRLKVLYK